MILESRNNNVNNIITFFSISLLSLLSIDYNLKWSVFDLIKKRKLSDKYSQDPDISKRSKSTIEIVKIKFFVVQKKVYCTNKKSFFVKILIFFNMKKR
jgi:hypothetical protein